MSARGTKYGARLVEACADVRERMEDQAAWARFYRAARADYERLAASLMRRWSLPAAVELEDVVQEMFLATPRFVRDWDPRREGARPLVDYVVFNVCDKAVKWAHRQRRAGDGKARSRHEIAFSAVRGAADDFEAGRPALADRVVFDRWREEVAREETEARLEGRAFYERIRERLNGSEMRLFDRAFARLLDLDEAAAIMYTEEPAECLRLRAGSRDDVRRAMAGVVRRALEFEAETAETTEGDR